MARAEAIWRRFPSRIGEFRLYCRLIYQFLSGGALGVLTTEIVSREVENLPVYELVLLKVELARLLAQRSPRLMSMSLWRKFGIDDALRR